MQASPLTPSKSFMRSAIDVAGLSLLGFGVMAGGMSQAHADEAKPVTPKQSFKIAPQILIASDGMVKGLSVTDGNGHVAASVTVTHGPFFATAMARNYRTTEGGDYQRNLMLGAKGEVKGFDLSGQVIYRDVVGTKAGTDHAWLEYQVDVARKLTKTLGVKLTYAYSPDSYAKTQKAQWTEFTVTQKVTPKLAISGAIGERTNTPKKDYTAYNLGATYALGKTLSVDARYYDTNKHEYGKRYENRFLVSLTKKF
jgi:uncharacterized protein (TIGR02001 family)